MSRAFEVRRAAKEKRSGKVAKLFPKLFKIITRAAKEGGEDPDMNASLSTAIQNAKSQNVPIDNIQNAIKRATYNDDQSYERVNYEVKAPHVVLIIV